MITLILPWPDPILSPNSRTHRRKRQEAIIQARNDAYVLTTNLCNIYDHGTFQILLGAAAQLNLVFSPPVRWRRDLDNCLASIKPFLDGVCLALRIDDSQIQEISLSWGPVVKGGAVKLSLCVLTEAKR